MSVQYSSEPVQKQELSEANDNEHRQSLIIYELLFERAKRVLFG